MTLGHSPIGHRTWVFPDGEIPPHDPFDARLKNSEVHGHESLVVLNPNPCAVQPRLHVYFTARDPWEIPLPEISPNRVVCYRMDEPIGLDSVKIPDEQYALVLRCNEPVVAQIGRMDIRQPNLAYYTVMGFPAD